jgi:hypothetical protein
LEGIGEVNYQETAAPHQYGGGLGDTAPIVGMLKLILYSSPIIDLLYSASQRICGTQMG